MSEKLQPGPLLDRLVAEKVMGLEVLQDDSGRSFTPLGNVGYSLPEYSTSIEAAWSVVDKLYPEFRLELNSILNGYCVQFLKVDMKDPFETWQVIGDSIESETVPHCICLAALKAVGADVG